MIIDQQCLEILIFCLLRETGPDELCNPSDKLRKFMFLNFSVQSCHLRWCRCEQQNSAVFGNSGFFCRSHLHHRSHHIFTGKISILAIFPGEAVRLWDAHRLRWGKISHLDRIPLVPNEKVSYRGTVERTERSQNRKCGLELGGHRQYRMYKRTREDWPMGRRQGILSFIRKNIQSGHQGFPSRLYPWSEARDRPGPGQADRWHRGPESHRDDSSSSGEEHPRLPASPSITWSSRADRDLYDEGVWWFDGRPRWHLSLTE